MPAPKKSTEIRNVAIDIAWDLGEGARKELGKGDLKKAEAMAAVAQAWATIASAGIALQGVRATAP